MHSVASSLTAQLVVNLTCMLDDVSTMQICRTHRAMIMKKHSAAGGKTSELQLACSEHSLSNGA